MSTPTILKVLMIVLVTLGTVVILYAALAYRQQGLVTPTVEVESIESLRARCFNMVTTDEVLHEMVFPQEATQSAELDAPAATESAPLLTE